MEHELNLDTMTLETSEKQLERANQRVREQLPDELSNRKIPRIEKLPWIERRRNWEAIIQLDGENSSKEGVEKVLKIITEEKADVVIYTDGSAAAGVSRGGAGVLVK